MEEEKQSTFQMPQEVTQLLLTATPETLMSMMMDIADIRGEDGLVSVLATAANLIATKFSNTEKALKQFCESVHKLKYGSTIEKITS